MADELRCCVCGSKTTPEQSTTFQLTAEEKLALRRAGQPEVNVCTYCRGCLKILSNREQGAQLLKGVLQTNLRIAGVATAEQQAQRFHNFLLDKAARKPIS